MGRDVRTLTFWNGLKSDDRGASAAIGNFDGVHLGHRTVVELARARADTLGAPLGIVTFEPHPREFLDRKSTRLNSSHVVISYAAFCL